VRDSRKDLQPDTAAAGTGGAFAVLGSCAGLPDARREELNGCIDDNYWPSAWRLASQAPRHPPARVTAISPISWVRDSVQSPLQSRRSAGLTI